MTEKEKAQFYNELEGQLSKSFRPPAFATPQWVQRLAWSSLFVALVNAIIAGFASMLYFIPGFVYGVGVLVYVLYDRYRRIGALF